MHVYNQLFLYNLEASLEWDTFEQICVWQLLNGEEPPVLSVATLLPDLHKSGICVCVCIK